METKRFLVCGLMISLTISFFSCNNNENAFYEKIKRTNNRMYDRMIAVEVVYNGKKPITVVMEKSDIIYEFEKYNQPIDDDFIIKTIKSGKPISVSKELYNKLYDGSQVIPQSRIDSLMNLGIENFFIKNHIGTRYLKLSNAIEDVTLMEELYAIQKLFEQKILLRRDDESGYYIEIK